MGILSLKKSAREIAPHGSLILGQIITASYIVLSKIILVQGISSSVFLVYQFILATIFISILAFIFERKKRPPLTRHILCWIFALALVGVTFTQSMLSGALYFTTSAIESSVLNMIPAITYILSLISRQEKLEIHTLWGKGKIFGTILSVSGALTLMLWHGSAANLMSTDLRNWLVGLVMVIVGVVAFSSWILMLVSSTPWLFKLGFAKCTFLHRAVHINATVRVTWHMTMRFNPSIVRPTIWTPYIRIRFVHRSCGPQILEAMYG